MALRKQGKGHSSVPESRGASGVAWWRSWPFRALVILAVTLAIYWPALQGDFVWDDRWYIRDNALLRDPAGPWKFWFQPGVWVEYYPLQETVMWLQWQLWGEGTLGYHLTNVFLHALSALLVWRLLTKFGLRHAWLGGLIFAVHPAQVESVAYVSELKNTLSLPFFLAAMCAWIDYDERRRAWDYRLSLGLFLLGMLCKITMAPFFFVIPLYAWWRRGKVVGSDVRAAAPFLVIALVTAFLTIWGGHRYESQGQGVTAAVELGGPLSRLALSGSILGYYFVRAIFPFDYSPSYPRWEVQGAAVAMWIVLTAVVFWAWKNRAGWGRHVLLGSGFFMLMLAPFLGFNAVSYMEFTWVMDHFLYLPLVGLIGLGMAGLGWLEDWLQPKRPYIAGLAAVVVILMAVESFAFANLFSNDETLWRYTLQRDPANWMAHNNLGVDLLARNRASDALAEFRETVRLKPDYADGHHNMGEALTRIGKNLDAQDAYLDSIRLNPRSGKSYLSLGTSYVGTGQLREAVDQYEQAVKLIPNSAELRYNLGSLLLKTGNFPEAIDQLRTAVQLQPGLPQMHENLGVALAQSGMRGGAIDEFREAIRLYPGYTIARNNLGLSLAQSGRIDEAIAEFEAVLKIDPNNAMAHEYLTKIRSAKERP